MTTTEFIYWLQGYLSVADTINFSTVQQWKFLYELKEALKKVKLGEGVLLKPIAHKVEEPDCKVVGTELEGRN